MTATALAVAFIVYSCKGKIEKVEMTDLSQAPVQTVDRLFSVQSSNGVLQMRVEADLMERYSTDSSSYEVFPKGISVYAYNEEGLLETSIFSDNARHEVNKRTNEEIWSAFGNVVIENAIKQETMETDTIYWDRSAGEIFTDCYVRMFSPDGFLQGYGMRSDEKARNAIINKPFNTYGVVVRDTTAVLIDSVNFIGPFMKK